MRIFRKQNESGVAVVEFAVVAPVLIVATLIGIFWGIHVTKRFIMERAIDTKAEIMMLSTSENRAVIASASVPMIYGFNSDEYATFIFNCTLAVTPTCLEIVDARSGDLVVSNAQSRVIDDLQNLPISLPSGERIIVVAGFMQEPAAASAMRMMLQGNPGQTMITSIVPLQQ